MIGTTNTTKPADKSSLPPPPPPPSCTLPDLRSFLNRGDEDTIHDLPKTYCASRDAFVTSDTRTKVNSDLTGLKSGLDYCNAFNGDNINSVYKLFNDKQTVKNCKVTINDETKNWSQCSDAKCCQYDTTSSSCKDKPSEGLSAGYIALFVIVGIIIVAIISAVIYGFVKK